MSISFNFLIVFVSHFKFANPETFDDRLEIFNLAYRGRTKCKNPEPDALLLHLLDQLAISVLSGSSMCLIDHKEHDSIHVYQATFKVFV